MRVCVCGVYVDYCYGRPHSPIAYDLFVLYVTSLLDHLSLSPSLPLSCGVTSLIFRGIVYGDGVVRLEADQLNMKLARVAGVPLLLNYTDSTGKITTGKLAQWPGFDTLPRQTARLSLL